MQIEGFKVRSNCFHLLQRADGNSDVLQEYAYYQASDEPSPLPLASFRLVAHEKRNHTEHADSDFVP